MTPPDPAKLLSVIQVADVLHMSRQYVSREANAGRLKFVRLGGRLRFRPEWVAEFVRRQEGVGYGPTAGTD